MLYRAFCNPLSMTTATDYPASLLLEGPLFADELKTQPQNFRAKHELHTLRLVPSKSGASGVYAIYFLPEHRQWALVRLATRYRALFEVQLLRGMSGEQQMIRQEFTSDDLAFLWDILPLPAKEYNPVVYDILWKANSHEEYGIIAREIAARKTFVPKVILQSTAELTVDDDGFFIPFIRSHLIRPKIGASANKRRNSNPRKSNVSIDIEAEHELTSEGREALSGIVAEYERLFEEEEFEPLLINPNLDPLEHLREYERKPTTRTPTTSIDELEENAGILGEIVTSFTSVDDEDPSSTSSPETPPSADQADSGRTDQTAPPTRTPHPKNGETVASDRAESSNTENAKGRTVNEGNRGHSATKTPIDSNDRNRSASNESHSQEPTIGDFTREEVVGATVAAARLITERTLVQTSDVKAAVWESVELEERSRTSLWEIVCDVLVEMESVYGRRGGRIWTATEYK